LFWHSNEYLNDAGIRHGEKCLILDIDQLVVGNMDEVLEFDLPAGHVGLIRRWWSFRQNVCRINGGFQMFRAGVTEYVFRAFDQNPLYWQGFYVANGLARGPVNGEQNFLDGFIDGDLRTYLPSAWVGKYQTDNGMLPLIIRQWTDNVDRSDPWEPYVMDGHFHSDLKLIHFANANNMIENHEDWIKKMWLGDS
jgi:hypothetical protein